MRINAVQKRAILANMKEVQAGTFTDKSGKEISYDASTKLFVLTENEVEVTAYKIAKKAEKEVVKTLEDAHFGALLNIVFDGSKISSVTVLSDPLADFEQENDSADLFQK